MVTVHLLGTGAAISGAGRTTTMICATEGTSTLLIDCGGDVVARMQIAGVGAETVRALFLTHEHIDHVGGFPLLYKKLWLAGRRDALPVYGLPPAIVQAARCFATYDTRAFVGLPPIAWHTIDPSEEATVFADDTWSVHAACGAHGVPVVGLRVVSKVSGRTFTYSSDTSPSDAIMRLARGTDLLLHEATGPQPGHSTAVQAAEIACRARVRKLVLVHLPPKVAQNDLDAARKVFTPLELGQDHASYTL